MAPLPVILKNSLPKKPVATETQLKDNGFWLGYLTSQLQNEDEPKQVLSYLESLKELNPEALKATVQYRLNPDNFIRMVLLPEK
jgi:zinc protease